MPDLLANNFKFRRSFGKTRPAIDVQNLIQIQRESYEEFLQSSIDPAEREIASRDPDRDGAPDSYEHPNKDGDEESDSDENAGPKSVYFAGRVFFVCLWWNENAVESMEMQAAVL